METYNNEIIESSCMIVQREWRELINEICRLKQAKLIDENAAKKIITRLVEFDHIVIENQNLIFQELSPSKEPEIVKIIKNKPAMV